MCWGSSRPKSGHILTSQSLEVEHNATYLLVAKTSGFAVEHLPVARVTNLASFIEELKELNVWVVGVESSGQMAYTEFNYSGATALVFGGEGGGLHRLVRERCDAVVSIPMRGKLTSLNVSVAVGVVLFEALRQRSASR